MKAVRNIAIIAALAFVVAAVPGGGNAATAVLTTITIAFLAVIAWAVYQLYRSQQLAILALTDAQRAVLVAAVGAIVLLVAGADEMLDTGEGTLVWIGLLAASIVAIWRLWVQSHSY